MPVDCFDCLNVEKAVETANKKGGKAIMIIDEFNSVNPSQFGKTSSSANSTERQANRIIARRKEAKRKARGF